MTLLKERYVAAALERVPDRLKDEVGPEIRAAIDEMVDQRVEQGEAPEIATERALNELGDPGMLAASYQEQPRSFIGPGWFPAYLTTMKRVPVVVLPLIALGSLLTSIGVDGEGVSDAIQGTLENVFLAAVQIVFWITLGFVIAERVVGPQMPSGPSPWTVAHLPDAPARRQIGLGSVLPEIIALLVAAVIVAAQMRDIAGIGFRLDPEGDDHLAVLNPETPGYWAAAFFALVSLSLFASIARYVVGSWTRVMTVLEIAVSALWSVFIVALAASEPIINPAFAERVDQGASWWTTGGTANVMIAIVIIGISLQAAWEAWTGYRAHRKALAAFGT